MDRALQEILVIESLRLVYFIGCYCCCVGLLVLKDVEVGVAIYATRFQEMSAVDEGKALSVALLIMCHFNHFFLLVFLNFLLKR